MAAVRQAIVVTGASSGSGRLTAAAPARGGHAVGPVPDRHGRLDVVRNAGHTALGPAETFTAEDVVAGYDVNVLTPSGSTAPSSTASL
jgi:NADP-dependent 3-hydroxy acid dehydrogenase YdfG